MFIEKLFPLRLKFTRLCVLKDETRHRRLNPSVGLLRALEGGPPVGPGRANQGPTGNLSLSLAWGGFSESQRQATANLNPQARMIRAQ